MADLIGRLKRHPRLLVGGIAALFVGVLLLAFTRPNAEVTGVSMASHRVSEGPFAITQSFSGRIAPGEQVEVLSPGDASVIEIGFAFGDRVEAGQVLFRLDPDDVWRQEAEARIAYLTAEESARKILAWEQGPEMRRAERGLENARHQLEDIQRRHDEAKRLFERGLIARVEMESQQNSLRQAREGLETAREELAATRARGTGTERSVTLLQQGLAATRLKDASGGGPVIVAPRAGIMVRAPSGNAGQETGPKVGGKVSKGQSLGVIAALDGLDVVFRVDEADLALLEPGTPAVVSGPGFSGRHLKGRLLSVAGEAEPSGSGERTQFSARVRLDPLDPRDAAIIRIGMTGHVSLTLYEAERALSVPVPALVDGRPQLRVRQADGTAVIRDVTLGRIGPERAEVLSGLAAGETVVWPLPGRSGQ